MKNILLKTPRWFSKAREKSCILVVKYGHATKHIHTTEAATAAAWSGDTTQAGYEDSHLLPAA